MSPSPHDRCAAAEIRALDAYRSVTRSANRLLDELEEATDVHGVPTTDLDEDDSAVIVLAEARRVCTSG